jgi:hypothetical protein
LKQVVGIHLVILLTPECNQWEIAMKDEYESPMKTKTQMLVDLPPGRKTIKCKLVYKLKLGTDGTIYSKI